MDNECDSNPIVDPDRDAFSLHVRSGHVDSRFVGISIVLPYSGLSPARSVWIGKSRPIRSVHRTYVVGLVVVPIIASPAQFYDAPIYHA